jgi:hypothetical protein
LKIVLEKYHAIGFTFVTRSTIYHHLRNRRADNIIDVESMDEEELAVVDVDDVEEEDDSCNNSSQNEKKTGRKKGCSKITKKKQKESYLAAITAVCTNFSEIKQSAKMKGKKVSPGLLKTLIEETEKEFGLPLGSIKTATVLKRVARNNVTVTSHQSISPLVMIEPYIVDWCVRLSNMGAALTKDQVIALAESLIDGTEYKDKLIAFKKRERSFC